MSKARASARAVREAAAAERAAADKAQRERHAAQRARRERRSLLWRRMRLWQHGSGFHRRRDAWAGLATLALVVLLVTYLFTNSVHAVVLVAFILVLAGPMLVMLTFDRRHR
jgi:Flp pilus assembly protein TadB